MIGVRRLDEIDRARLLQRPTVVTPAVIEADVRIVAEVRAGGDDVVRRFTKQFDKVEVLSVAPVIADAIRAVFEDTSVSEIFDGENLS